MQHFEKNIGQISEIDQKVQYFNPVLGTDAAGSPAAGSPVDSEPAPVLELSRSLESDWAQESTNSDQDSSPATTVVGRLELYFLLNFSRILFKGNVFALQQKPDVCGGPRI